VLNDKVRLIKNKLERLELRFVELEEITKDQYIKFKDKLETERREIEKSFRTSKLSFSNPEVLIKKGIEFATRLTELWRSGNFKQKQALQNRCFPRESSSTLKIGFFEPPLQIQYFLQYQC